MSLKIISAILFSVFMVGCQFTENKPAGTDNKQMNYSYACLDSAVGGNRANKILEKGGDLVREFAVDESTITDEVQNQYGEAFHKDAIESGTFKLLQDERINSQLEKIMNDLLAVRENPSAIKYYIYAVDDPMVNAFTFGGRIYLTTGMYDKCKGKTALLYGIIGHEIGHSERGHIKRTIQEMQVSTKIFGENGMNLYQLKRLLTASFNQKFELEADYYGTDLAYRLRQDVCAAVIFWREMSKQENTYSQLEDFFRSHPFSELRAKCLETHIRTNFHRTCEG